MAWAWYEKINAAAYLVEIMILVAASSYFFFSGAAHESTWQLVFWLALPYLAAICLMGFFFLRSRKKKNK